MATQCSIIFSLSKNRKTRNCCDQSYYGSKQLRLLIKIQSSFAIAADLRRSFTALC